MTMQTAGNFSLEIKRLIKAPRASVSAAWTDPAQLKQWFGPEKVQTRALVADARVGGEFRWDLTSSEMTMCGEFRELEPDGKIVCTWRFEDDEDWGNRTSVMIELADRDGGTEVRLTHENLPSGESRDGHESGWNSALDKLEKFLASECRFHERATWAQKLRPQFESSFVVLL